MIRSIFGFAVFAVLAMFAVKVFFKLFGLALGLVTTVLWLAFWGWIIYLILKLFAPRTAASIKESISGKPAA
jgi:hypothetical protein